MIIVEPLGGLANRMRVIASSLWLQKQTGQKLQLIWNLKNELNCPFDSLFYPINDLNVNSKKAKYKHVKASNQKKLYKKILSYLINNSIGIDYCIKEKDFSDPMWTDKINLLKFLLKKRNLYIQTYQEFGENYKEFSKFIPKDEIQYLIDLQTEKFNNNTIGIHIRRSDNKLSIEKSPINLFIDKLNYEIEKDKNVNFFLATDDISTEHELINIFGDKIISYKKELSRNSEKGIKDAVVDLYCLSQTKFIYGSYWSSYSEIASRIGNIELITLNKEIIK
jgi:hypothetical protein